MTDEEFWDFFATVPTSLDRKLADELGCAYSTISRYRNRITKPMPRTAEWLVSRAKELIEETNKIKLCDKQTCGSIAVWTYAPNNKHYYCDEHVPRGCSCNLIHIGLSESSTDNVVPININEQYKDDKGRLLPCCEYDYNEVGFPIVNTNG